MTAAARSGGGGLPRFRIRVTRGGADSLSWFILFSLLAHVSLMWGLTGLQALLPRHAPARPPDPGFFVSLAELPPGGGPLPRAAATPVEEPPAKPEPAPEVPPPPPEKPKEVLLPEKPKEAKPRPEASKPPPSSTTKTAEEPVAPAARPGPDTSGAGIEGAPPGPGVPGGEGDVMSLDLPDFEHAWYTARVVSRLKGVWRRPHLPDAISRSATIAFTIMRDGSVRDVRVETSSGYEPLDISAVRSVYDAAPLPPLPARWEGDALPARMVYEVTPDS